MDLFKTKKFIFLFILILSCFFIFTFSNNVQATNVHEDITINVNNEDITITNSSLLSFSNINLFVFYRARDNYVFLKTFLSNSDSFRLASQYSLDPLDDYTSSGTHWVRTNLLGYSSSSVGLPLNIVYKNGVSWSGSNSINQLKTYLSSHDFTTDTLYTLNNDFDFYVRESFDGYWTLSNYNDYDIYLATISNNQWVLTNDITLENTQPSPQIVYPYFVQGQDFSSGNFDDILIVRDLSFIDNVYNGNIYLHIAEVNYNVSLASYYYSNIKDINLANYYTYFDIDNEQVPNIYISVPYTDLNYNFVEGKTYMFLLNSNSRFEFVYTTELPTPNEDNVYDVDIFTIGNDDINYSIYNSINNFYDTMFSNNIDSSTTSQIDDSLNYNNSSNADSIATGFFSRITNKFTSMLGYNLNEDTIIRIPLRNSYIDLHSNFINSHIPNTLKTIITMFWAYIFGFYLLKFILKIYRQIKTGNILENFDTSGESITTTML